MPRRKTVANADHDSEEAEASADQDLVEGVPSGEDGGNEDVEANEDDEGDEGDSSSDQCEVEASLVPQLFHCFHPLEPEFQVCGCT
jgi:hypothetical protein